MNLKKEIAEVRDSVDTSYILERSKFVNVEDQKTFLDRKWVWVPDEEMTFIPGWIVEDKDDILEVDCDGDIRKFRSSEVMKMNPPKFDMVEDLAALSHLNEPSVLYNLTKRYKRGYIYTYSGLFLLAINPYRELNIYSLEFIKKYTMKKKNELDPHIFAVANEAYNSMLTNNENQSILITGESGAGKTENTKKVIEFLASVAGYKTEGISIDKKIIDSNPILEAFGNAKTVKNDNSSRFGKFIQIKFSGGNICGANIEKYLLEKSRITGQNQNKNERNYHIFYQLLKGADSSLQQALFLDGFVESYKFLKNGCHFIEGVDDGARFRELRGCMRALDIDEETELFYYKIVAAVLHLGNLEFEMKNKQVEIVNVGSVEKICRLLSISSSDFIKCLIHPEIKAGHEVVTQHRTVEQVYRIVEALAKILYDKMFDSLIANLNRSLGTTVSSSFIGVLDIAGFEIFQENSFEQLCINFTNEKLQQFFNHHMFILEQEIYRQEAIDWNFIDFGLDLQPTIDLIESNNPIGIMAYLDEECVMPMASDKTFLEKLVKNIKNPKFKKINFKDSFYLQHYAGDVEYSVVDWIIKNKDPNFESITSLINKSEDAGVSGLSFTESKNLKKGFFRTVSQKHKDQLFCLMKTLASTNPHFVRCIIPNLQKRGDHVENRLILEQLKCNGVLEGIRISRQGFPSRMKYSEFVERYQLLLNSSVNNTNISTKNNTNINTKNNSYYSPNVDVTKEILNEIKISPTQFRLGKTKIFFRQSVLADIEDIRDKKISSIMREVQCIARRKMALRKWNIEELRMKSIVCLKKNARLCVDLQNWNWWKLYLKIKPLLDVRRRDNEIKEKENTISKYSNLLEKEKKVIKDLEKKIKNIQAENDALLKGVESEKQYSHEKDELMNAIRLKNSELEEKVRVQEEESRNLQDFLEKTMNKLSSVSTLRDSEIQNYERKLEENKSKIDVLSQELLLKEEEIKKTYLELHTTENETKTQFEKFVEAKEKEVEDLKEKIKNYNNSIGNYKDSIKDYKDAINSLTKNLENSKGRVVCLEERVGHLKEVLEKEKKAYEDLKEKSNGDLRRLKDENLDLQTEIDKFETETNKLLRQNEEKENEIKKMQAENDFTKLNNSNLLKNISALKDRIQEMEKREEEINNSQSLKDSTHEALLEKIKSLEKKNKNLLEKNKHLENLNLQLTGDKEEIHKQNLSLLQSKLDDIFQREAEFNSIKNRLQVENQKLTNENQRMSRELYEQRIQSESSEDSNSGTEKLYFLLEQEKKTRREAEQKVVEKESTILILRNDNEELKERNEEIQNELNSIKEDLHTQRNNSKEYSLMSREVDGLLEKVNGVINGINEKYFKILEENRKGIQEMNEKLTQKEEEIKNLNICLMKKEEEYGIALEKNENLSNLNKIKENKIENLLNEFDSTKIKSVVLETELEEKKVEINLYKQELERLEGLVADTQKMYNEEINSYKEECDTFIQKLKLEQTNLIQNFKNKENKMKMNFEEKVENMKEIYKKKHKIYKDENENLKKVVEELENKIREEMKREYNGGSDYVSVNGSSINGSSINGSSVNGMVKEPTFIPTKDNSMSTSYSVPTKDNSMSTSYSVPTKDNSMSTYISTSSPRLVYVIDKQKLKDLERKKLIFLKELETNRENIVQLKKDLEKYQKENGTLKNERLNLKSQVFELRKNNKTLEVKLSHIERELKDEKELVGFLKGFTMSRNKK